MYAVHLLDTDLFNDENAEVRKIQEWQNTYTFTTKGEKDEIWIIYSPQYSPQGTGSINFEFWIEIPETQEFYSKQDELDQFLNQNSVLEIED